MAERKPRAGADESSLVEWVIAGAASLVVIGLIVIFVIEALTTGENRARFDLAVINRHDDRAGTLVEVAVTNRGDGAANGVEIEGTAPPEGGQPPPTAHATLNQSPAGSTRRVTLIFPPGVATEPLDLRVVGYAAP